ncbi:hypothetical protein DOU07_02425, partial [Clavibacter michiganensis subsp. michiganensis]|uniref:hypothetical protein n=1 Tax=Clavibacter michiganensis TaxID=28447 RepID=UPI0013667F5E
MSVRDPGVREARGGTTTDPRGHRRGVRGMREGRVGATVSTMQQLAGAAGTALFVTVLTTTT